MLKLAPNYACFALALSLLPLVQGVADAKPSNSFKSGFSSQRSSSSSSSSNGSFGSFGKRSSPSSSSPRDAGASSGRSGGFGSFGRGAAPGARRSDSALSRKLDREASEARALRTLDERRAAQAAQAGRNAAPPPSDQAPRNQPYNAPPAGYGPAQAPAQPPVIVRRDSALGHVIAGAVIANMAANAHAQHGNGQQQTQQQQQQPAPLPAPTWNGGVDSVNGVDGQALPAGSAPHSRGGSAFGTIVTLVVLALVVWGVVTLVRRRKRKAGQQNYSFERN